MDISETSRLFRTRRARIGVALTATLAASLAHAAPAIFYTDLPSAPAGAFVTVFGKRFTGATVAGAEVVSQTDTKVVLKWQGTDATIGGIAVPVTTRTGRIREATTSTLSSVCSSVQ